MIYLARAAAPAAALGVLAAAACGPKSRLEPASGAEAAGEDTVAAQAEGIALSATVDAWPGDPGVLAHVTPIRVTIRNRSERPLRLQYRSFTLVNARGKRFAALPPYKLEGSVTEPVVVSDRVDIDTLEIEDNDFVYRAFELDPAYGPVYGTLYPDLALYPDALDYDLAYYDTYHAYWKMSLPTPEMLARVLPEGVLQPGGEVSGFLYFEKVGEDSERVQLKMALVGARQADPFGTITLPFMVQG